MHSSDTIAAVSSPPGRSPRGLLRISGPDARAILTSLSDVDATESSTSPTETFPARQLTIARLRFPSAAGPLPLPALVTFFAAPRTYTGQDLAEIQLPGNPALLDRLLHAVIAQGARLAEPGEFTFRAYLAGKLDLTQAEGVAATIAAVSDSQLRAASALREGTLATFARRLVDDVGTALALVEAGIDFTDQDDVVPIAPGDLFDRLADIETRLADLLSRSRSWGVIEALPRVVLVGEPSAGKSTLFNALLGRNRAVISATPGTTRDVLCEPLTLAPPQPSAGETGEHPGEAEAVAAMEVMLVDIAGLDEPRHLLDRAMQDAARRAIASADLALVIDDGRGVSPGTVHAVPDHVPTLHIRTKADARGPGVGWVESAKPTTDAADAPLAADDPSAHAPQDAIRPTLPLPLPKREGSTDSSLAVSAHTGAGLAELRAMIARKLADRAVSVSGEAMALQPRHESALRLAREAVAAAIELLAPQRANHALANIELIAGTLRRALDELAGLGGTLTPDDVIGRVFATFCVGK